MTDREKLRLEILKKEVRELLELLNQEGMVTNRKVFRKYKKLTMLLDTWECSNEPK